MLSTYGQKPRIGVEACLDADVVREDAVGVVDGRDGQVVDKGIAVAPVVHELHHARAPIADGLPQLAQAALVRAGALHGFK